MLEIEDKLEEVSFLGAFVPVAFDIFGGGSVKQKAKFIFKIQF